MRKQTIASLIVGAALLIAAVVYTLLYAYFDLQYVDRWQRILLIVLLMVIAAAMVALFVNRSHLREEMVRRYYLSPEWVYNHEIGYAPLSQAAPNGDAYEFVTFAADALIEMSYGFEVAETPQDFQPQYMVSTKVFRVRQTGDGAVVSQWKGALHRVVSDSHGTMQGLFAQMEHEDCFARAGSSFIVNLDNIQSTARLVPRSTPVHRRQVRQRPESGQVG